GMSRSPWPEDRPAMNATPSSQQDDSSRHERPTVPPAAPDVAGQPTVPPLGDSAAGLLGDTTVTPPSPAGVHIPGYDIFGELGRGGMGVVYQARHLALNRVVALKMIRDSSLAGEAERARFKTEAEAVARLQHPHIVQIHEIGEHYGLPYFSLEFCPGGCLEK